MLERIQILLRVADGSFYYFAIATTKVFIFFVPFRKLNLMNNHEPSLNRSYASCLHPVLLLVLDARLNSQ